MSTLWQDIQYKMLKNDSRINLLIGINVIVFLLINIPVIGAFSREYLLLNASSPLLLTHPWTPLSYMFMHEGFFQILFNMLWLYWMGRVFEEFLNHTRLLGVYIGGALAGALLYIAGYNLLNLAHISVAASFITGASVSVMAIMVATATLLPEFEVGLIIIGPVKLKWICVFYVTLALLGAKDNPGAEMAYVGGALFGFVYIKQLQKGKDLIGFISKLFRPKPKMRVVTFDNREKKSPNVPRQEEIDRILDKIYISGMESLSKQEKETLSRVSNNNER